MNPLPLDLPLPPLKVVMVPTVVDSIPSNEVEDSNNNESINDFTPPMDTPIPSSCASKPPPPFSNQLKGIK